MDRTFTINTGCLVKHSGKSLAASQTGTDEPEPGNGFGQVPHGFALALLKVWPGHMVWALGPSLVNPNKTEAAGRCPWQIHVGFTTVP